MPDALSKMDKGLSEILSNYHYLQENGWDDPGWLHPALEIEGTHIVPVEIRFTGNAATIVENGLTITGEPEDEYVVGMIDLDHLEVIGANPQILEMNYGNKPTLSLDSSTIEINARKGTDPAQPFVWDVNKTNGTFTGNTGEDVIVGIIDTGIDFKHPVFLKTATETRILRIWDQGLVKQGAENSPDVTLLKGNQTYGVEYTDQMINKVLQKVPGALPIRHQDCVGHGTHVASIAAGDGRAVEFLAGSGFEYVGVAPKAFIIMVKFLALQTQPPATVTTQFEDAITYILRTAKSFSPAKPVVINCSFGSDLGPHDGMEKDELFVSELFKQAAGQACVFAAGNASGKRHHAIITIPPGGTIEVPFDFEDTRTFKKNKRTCVLKSTTRSRDVEIWYGNIAPAQIKFSVKIPGAAGGFTAPMSLGDIKITDTKNRIELVHKTRGSATPAGGTAITRNNFTLTTNPDGDNHRTGTFIIKIEGPANSILHAWCDQGDRQNFKALTGEPPAALAGVNITDLNTLGGLGCAANVITVAAYDDVSGKLANFSSKGPLVKYAGNANVLPEKPDIAAPGVNVNAAKSANHDFPVEFIKNMLGFKYLTKNGTSMAAPHITGVIALMLKKTKTLQSDKIKEKIKTFFRAALPADSFGKGKVDAKKVLDNS